MLELRNIKKNYYVASETVEALKGVSINFRKNEFVAILGPSGCGKTTLLNIIGGLDQYTKGDLFIKGKSTKEFKSRDWDSYRNHTIGFVFQTYNLIPHQTVLANVELALTLSGVSKAERRKRAIDALTEVGLADKIHNKPNQLSGGQMQRVAIARALVNNPDVLLADEPTGALDTKTSVQIMDILKSISKNKLIIMVTHNPQLAEEYANRIVKLVDGVIIDDSNPYNGEDQPKGEVLTKNTKEKINKAQFKKTSMSFWTALSLSFKNLLTKKARTIMVAFAGSIGIIGIALILSVSNGFTEYIDKVQEDTLSTYPIQIDNMTMDMGNILADMEADSKEEVKVEDGIITSDDSLLKLVEMAQKMKEQALVANNLKAFKEYIESTDNIQKHTNAIQYVYDVPMNIYNNEGLKVNPNDVFQVMMGDDFEQYMGMLEMTGMSSMILQGFNVWTELLDNEDLIKSQYDLLGGKWPESENDIVIVVDENNQISDYVLHSLGLKDRKEIEDLLDKYAKGEEITYNETMYTYEQILDLEYTLVLPYLNYEKNKETGIWTDISKEEGFFDKVKNDENGAIKLNVSGILRPKEGASATSISGSIGYLSSLTMSFDEKVKKSDIYKEQLANEKINVFTGQEFYGVEMLDQIIELVILNLGYDNEKANMLRAYADKLPPAQLAEYINSLFKQNGIDMAIDFSDFETNLTKLGHIDYDNPVSIKIFAKDFESKEAIADEIEKYNASVESPDDEISYTDMIGTLLSSVSTIIDVISYVLIAFVSISLVVSSIMIGVITYISVLERTKEIGILRSIGARKSDISRVFTAETLVVGFAAGAMGITISFLLVIPINLIINHFAGFPINAARLPWGGAFILIGISMLLTVIAGLLPSRLAAKRDPVEALRSE